MSIKVNYNATTGEIDGYYPDDIIYGLIPEPYIEIDEDTHQDCINNQGLRKVDIETLAVVTCEAAVVELTTAEKITALDTEYQTQFDALIQALGAATLASDTDLIAVLQEEYATLKAEYTAAREALENG